MMRFNCSSRTIISRPIEHKESNVASLFPSQLTRLPLLCLFVPLPISLVHVHSSIHLEGEELLRAHHARRNHGEEAAFGLPQGAVLDAAVAIAEDHLFRFHHAGFSPPRVRAAASRRRARPASPPALLSAGLRSGPVYAAASPPPSLYDQLFASFDFRSSLVDLPAVSAARALLVLCAYALCGGRGAYLAITAICSAASIGYVSIKAVCAFGVSSVGGAKRVTTEGKDGALAVEALFLSSLALAVAHVAVAYRTSCRERRKLLVYRIDIEAVKQKEAKLKEQIKL
uniref:Uncharacterized protein n=1 Tax=Ananas comosus var. bracteatus TaxID=296719 RepID=A0A6V7QN37_ANACO|nr:unnamed protein product [Ananas comosus var. bracteatus]